LCVKKKVLQYIVAINDGGIKRVLKVDELVKN